MFRTSRRNQCKNQADSQRCLRAASFAKNQANNFKALRGQFELDHCKMKIRKMRIPERLQRQDACIVEYDAIPVKSRFVALLRRLFLHEELRDEIRERYKRPGGLKRFLFLLLPGRVSRIHLYEAQERYVYLHGLLDTYGTTKSPDGETKEIEVNNCRKRLNDLSVLLSRRQNDINFLWREMNQVQGTILEKILPPEKLPAQLDFCREEAYRLSADKEHPEINEMIYRLAEVMNQKKEDRSEKLRPLLALIDRFNTIRTGRIHEQFVNIRCYQTALLMLFAIAILLIDNQDLILKSTPKDVLLPKFQLTGTWGFWGLDFFLSLGSYILALAEHLLTTNMIAFVFFAGLAGGFFSVAIRLRSKNLIPGEDAYFVWYVLTKPFVGALGAAILFILLQAQFVSFDFGDKLLKMLSSGACGPELFGFAFLAGFSERIVFPNLR